jgi:flagellar P-ring protein precursor FlgI
MRIALLLMSLLPLLTAAVEEAAPPAAAGVRLKDLCDIYGVRDNQLHGIGIVVGLSGTGDKSLATVRMLRQMLATKQLSFSETDLATSSVAMVAVTADLPAFSRNGSRLHTQVACLGNAASLAGGILLQTPLVGADEKVYAVGQGPVSVGGTGNAGPGLAPTGIDHKNQLSVAILTQGALVERELPDSLLLGDRLRLVLRDPDFTTASRVSRVLGELFGAERVTALDSTMVTVSFAPGTGEQQLVDAIATLQELHVSPDTKARVVINARTGTVVAGSQVRISAVAVSQGGLSLRVIPRTERVAQRSERGRTGEPPAEPETRTVYVDSVTRERFTSPPAGTQPTQIPGSVTIIDGASVEEIANALNALGARPRDLVAIFEAVQRAGALHAELVVM